MSGSRILVVDDEADIRDALTQALEAEGYVIATAANGRQALARAHDFRPDLVLLDLMMPVCNGWQFLEMRRHDPAVSDVPVLMLSALEAVRDRAPAGNLDFLKKPYDLEQLLTVVKRLVRPMPTNR